MQLGRKGNDPGIMPVIYSRCILAQMLTLWLILSTPSCKVIPRFPMDSSIDSTVAQPSQTLSATPLTNPGWALRRDQFCSNKLASSQFHQKKRSTTRLQPGGGGDPLPSQGSSWFLPYIFHFCSKTYWFSPLIAGDKTWKDLQAMERSILTKGPRWIDKY